MKRETIITFLAVLLCVLPACGGTAVSSTGDEGTCSVDGSLLFRGENVVEFVNLRGDETTVYKLDDGKYIDRTSTVFVFDGADNWTDENGVEWNKSIR